MKKIALIRQRDQSDCGAACLASVAACYGLFVPVARIRQWAGTDIQGTSIYGLIQAAGKLGMDARGVRADFRSLEQVPLPAIAQIMIQQTTSHFVVVMQVDPKIVLIMDPAEGRFKKISCEEFAGLWTGVLVITVPGENFRKNERITNISKISEWIKPHRTALMVAVGCSIGYSVLGLSSSVYLKEIMDVVLEKSDRSFLMVITVAMAAMIIFQFLMNIARGYLIIGISQKIDARLILGYCDHLLRLPQSFFNNMRVGELLSRVNDAIRINIFISETAIQILVDVLILFSSLILMFLYHWKLALASLFLMPVYIILFWLNDRINKKWQRRVMVSGAEFDARLVQTLHSASTIKMLGAEITAIEKISASLMLFLNHSKKFGYRQLFIQSATELYTRVFMLIVVWMGCYYVLDDQLSKGTLLSFFALISYFSSPVLYLFGAAKSYRDAIIASERLSEISLLETEISHQEPVVCDPANGNIVFSDVSFRYGNTDYILQRINLTIHKGSFVGISGASGSGKSTLAALLLKLYQPSEGSITINGCDINHIPYPVLRKMIACVPQQTELFAATIKENITLGEKSPGDEWLDIIAAKLDLEPILCQMPLGWQTSIQEHGNVMSGGQKQKIAIARALYRQSPILLLDEPTASLDTFSALKIMQTIEWYRSLGNTVIIIAHHEHTLKFCDNIALLINGRIT